MRELGVCKCEGRASDFVGASESGGKGQNPVPPHSTSHASKTTLLFEAWKVITSPCPHVMGGVRASAVL